MSYYGGPPNQYDGYGQQGHGSYPPQQGHGAPQGYYPPEVRLMF